jgi:hypothetical protein
MIAKSETRNERERKHDRAIEMRGKGQAVHERQPTNDSDSKGIGQVQTALLKKEVVKRSTLQNSSTTCNIIPVTYKNRGQ